jgi:hypothetical protein
LPAKGTDSPLASDISEKTFTLEPNEKHIETLSFYFMEDMCHVTLKSDSTDYNLTFGAGHWITGETTRPQPNLLLSAKAHSGMLPTYKVAGCFAWKDNNTLELVLRYIESPHSETMICRFDKNKVSVDIQYSNDFGKKQPELKGKINSTNSSNGS